MPRHRLEGVEPAWRAIDLELDDARAGVMAHGAEHIADGDRCAGLGRHEVPGDPPAWIDLEVGQARERADGRRSRVAHAETPPSATADEHEPQRGEREDRRSLRLVVGEIEAVGYRRLVDHEAGTRLGMDRHAGWPHVKRADMGRDDARCRGEDDLALRVAAEPPLAGLQPLEPNHREPAHRVAKTLLAPGALAPDAILIKLHGFGIRAAHAGSLRGWPPCNWVGEASGRRPAMPLGLTGRI